VVACRGTGIDECRAATVAAIPPGGPSCIIAGNAVTRKLFLHFFGLGSATSAKTVSRAEPRLSGEGRGDRRLQIPAPPAPPRGAGPRHGRTLDFQFSAHGKVWRCKALNQKARDWFAAHTERSSDLVWVQRRYAQDLIDRLREDGFQVEIVCDRAGW
jgi:hypothetical protein